MYEAAAARRVMVMATVDRNGVKIHYEVRGTGPAILVSHGFAASSHMFEGTAAALAASHRVITWDLRGHGRSDYPAEADEYSIPLAVGDMVAILDAAGADRAVLMGHSLGGYLSLELQRTHPERVSALVLIGTGPGYKRDEARDGWNGMAERFAIDLETSGLDALPASEEVRADVHRSADGLVRAARGILRQHDDRVLVGLPDITVPVLVVVGEGDKPFLAGSEYMAGKIPGAALTVIAGARHAPMITHPDAFCAHIATFLDERLAS
jgi:pimeloyl-ACP methyl ester carboxylesterase